MISAMSKSMNSMAYYIVMAFFCALFIDAFGKSNIGALMAIEGAEGLKAMQLPSAVTIIGIVILTGIVNLFVGAYFCAHADATGYFSGSNTSRLSCWRFHFEHCDTANALLSVGGCLLSTLCKRHRYWNRNFYDAAIQRCIDGGLDNIPAYLLVDWLATGYSGKLCLSLIINFSFVILKSPDCPGFFMH